MGRRGISSKAHTQCLPRALPAGGLRAALWHPGPYVRDLIEPRFVVPRHPTLAPVGSPAPCQHHGLAGRWHRAPCVTKESGLGPTPAISCRAPGHGHTCALPSASRPSASPPPPSALCPDSDRPNAGLSSSSTYVRSRPPFCVLRVHAPLPPFPRGLL